MLRHFLISSILLIFCIAVGSPVWAQNEGEWSGTTDEGNNVYFVVGDNTVTPFLIEICVYGGSGSFGGCFEQYVDLSLPISGDSFGYSSGPFDLTGHFANSNEASGTWNYQDGYLGYGNGTWSASFPALPVIELSPLSTLFGEQEVGSVGSNSTFSLRNKGGGSATGSIYLTGPDADQFEIVGGSGNFSLSHDQSLDIQVRFSPSSTGLKTATLFVNANTPTDDISASLTGTGTLPILQVSPNYQMVSERPGSTTFSVRNIGPSSNILSWTATVEPAENWLTISEGGSGTNNGTISLHFEENSGNARIGTIVVSAPGALNSPQTMHVLQAANRSAKMHASDGETGDFFGHSVSISGDYAIVGAHGDDDNGIDSGSAYIFERIGNGWTQRAKILANDGEAGDYFGRSVSISGNYVVVGAYGDDDLGSNSGSAYIFEKIGEVWIEQVKLTASDGVAEDRFGFSVSITADYAVIGAPGDDDNGYNSGSAYIFQQGSSGWSEATQAAKLTASDGYGMYNLYTPSFDAFGHSVHATGDYAIIGACGWSRKGSAYIFKRPINGWVTMTETAKLTPSDNETVSTYGGFGRSVSISGDYAVVGLDNTTSGPILGAGRAYIYAKPSEEWIDMTETAMIRASDGGSLMNSFGSSVSLSGEVVLVGARLDDENGSGSGSAYVFRKPTSGWLDMFETKKFTASDGEANDNFANSVSIDADSTIVGIPLDDDNGANSGSVLFHYIGNFPPRISDISNQTIYINTQTDSIPFSVSDSETLPESLIVTGASSNSALVPNENIVFEGTGVNRSVVITPILNRVGTTNITVSVSDGGETQFDTFSLTVFSTVPRGDINGDGTVDLSDVILSLQIVSGTEPLGTITTAADVNEDGQIGIEETIFMMRTLGDR